MKLYRLHSQKRANKFPDISHISGRVCGKSGLGSLRRIGNQEDVCGNKPLTAYSLTTYYLTHAIDFSEAETMQ